MTESAFISIIVGCKNLTADRGQFIVSKWTVCDSVTHPLFIDTSSVCTLILMTSTRYSNTQYQFINNLRHYCADKLLSPTIITRIGRSPKSSQWRTFDNCWTRMFYRLDVIPVVQLWRGKCFSKQLAIVRDCLIVYFYVDLPIRKCLLQSTIEQSRRVIYISICSFML